MLFRELICIYCENRTKSINTLVGKLFLTNKAGGIYCNHRASRCYQRICHSWRLAANPVPSLPLVSIISETSFVRWERKRASASLFVMTRVIFDLARRRHQICSGCRCCGIWLSHPRVRRNWKRKVCLRVWSSAGSSNPRPAKLCYTAYGSVYKFCMYYKTAQYFRRLGLPLVICPRAARQPKSECMDSR
jgi:hypothetical protein